MTQTTEGARRRTRVDWEFAKATGARLVPPGPRVTRERGSGVVASVRQAAARAQQPVAETARLHAPGTAPAALVVDRATWINVNADSMAAMLDPVFDELVGKRRQQPPARGGWRSAARSPAPRPARCSASWPARCSASTTSRPSGTPAAAARRPQHRPRRARARGRPAPTSGSGSACTRRPTGCSSPPCPWLRDHLIERARAPGRRHRRPTPSSFPTPSPRHQPRSCPRCSSRAAPGLADLFATPEQREMLDRITAVMSLLEGHADVVMDGVGPEVIPSRRADPRRSSTSAARAPAPSTGCCAGCSASRPRCAVPRRRRVRPRRRRRGRHGRLQPVWTSPETLPLPRPRSSDPAAWVRRVHG